MEYRAYLPYISGEEGTADCLTLTPFGNGLMVSAADAGNRGAFYRLLHLLQAGLAIYGYEHGWEELRRQSMRPAAGESTACEDGREAALKVPQNVWKEIQWIFKHEDRLAAYWWGVSLAAEETSKKYLALYYAAAELEKSGRWREENRPALEALKALADRIRLNEEDAEERGLAVPELVYDWKLFSEAQRVIEKHFEKRE